jgi:hypothetical protein
MNYSHFNGSRNFHAIGVSGATLIALFNSLFLASPSVNGNGSGSLMLLFTNPGSFFFIFLLVAITYVLNFVVDKTLLIHIQPSGASKAAIFSTFLAVFTLQIFSADAPHNALTWANFSSFVLLFFGKIFFACFLTFFLIGFHYVFSRAKKTLYVEKSELPQFFDGPQGVSSSSSQFSVGVFVQNAITQIFAGKESRRIFLYLCINLLFMFVEFAYGWWTNSLGLISGISQKISQV